MVTKILGNFTRTYSDTMLIRKQDNNFRENYLIYMKQ